jgi:phosphoglucosamine mutase
MGRLFGTDGVRGVANSELTPELAFNLGKAGASVLSRENSRPVIIIGKDTRLSGDMLENAITAGILAVGGNVIKVGVIPTPAIAYLTRYYRADSGIVISASHNPFEYNGIKFFSGEGYKLDDALEEKIEDLIIREIDTNEHLTGDQIGRCLKAEDNAVDLYCNFLLSTIDIPLDNYKVVLDCANGASYITAPRVYESLGADLTVIGNKPDGVNINDNIGSTHPEKLAEKVVEVGADVGLAFDGDADRLIVVDEKGRVVDGDKIICIAAKYLADQGRLAKSKVTATVMSNLGLHKYVENVVGGTVEVTGVGDRYVIDSMRKTGSVLGGEQSGHIIFKEYTTTGDGTLSSLQFMKALAASGKKVSELADEIVMYPQVLVNAKVSTENKKIFMRDSEIRQAIADAEAAVGSDGRVLIRPSGTEPLARVMIEGKDIEQIRALAEDIADLISSKYE